MRIGLIIGCARSGTSILGELIAAHPDVHYIYEAHEIWERGGMGANESHRLTEKHATPEVKASIRAWFAEQVGNKLAVEKCPRNTLRVPYLRALFPEAKIIYIVRDGRDVTCSLRPGIGGDEWRHLKPENWQELRKLPSVERCARTWLEVTETAERDLQGVDHLRIRYEELVENPHGIAERILEYLGLKPDPAVAEFCAKIQDQTKDSYAADNYSRKWNTSDHQKRIGRWRENLTEAEQNLVQEILGPKLQSLGYLNNES